MHAKAIARPASLVAILLIGLCLALAAPATASAMQSRAASFSTNYKVTGNPAQDMIAVAKAQEERHQEDLGYTEGWCADFVSDCAKTLKLGKAIPFNGMVSSLKDAVLAAGGTRVKTPAPGDLVFFGDAHVGIMTDKVNCISGNMSSPSRVRTCKVSWVVPGSKIVYVRPAYIATTYSIAFSANGGKGKMGIQTCNKGAVKALKANAFKRAGCSFAGWNTKPNGTGKAFANKQRVKNLTGVGKTLKLYAQWKAAPYTVVFKANGGKGKMAAQKIERGKAKSLKANTFKRKGYQFVGWNTKKNGKGTSYKNTQTVKNLAKAGKRVKLYAQWKKAKKRV